jgi:8-oxo-dGTP pyrophosphatase MutT (NUDIX family)
MANTQVDQAAVIPYRRTDDGIEVCLITTRSGRWGIPKGLVDPGDTPPFTALKEAEEEAGILGHLVGEAVGIYAYEKWDTELAVAVYLMQVERALDYWDEAEFRERKWVSPPEAIKLMADHPGIHLVSGVLLDLGSQKQ